MHKADVVVIGAGASGAVVARRLAEAGIDVLTLEQGNWPDMSLYPAPDPMYELLARSTWSGSPNVRQLPVDYPVDESESDISPLMFNGVGGSTVLYAADWPRLVPSDFRVRSLDGVADDWPITYDELVSYYERTDVQFGVSGLAGDPAYPATDKERPYPPLPIGKAGHEVARGHNELGWHWWPGTNAVLPRQEGHRRGCAQWGTCMQGCPEGAKASTDLTHWPQARSAGARILTGARVARLEVDSHGSVHRAEFVHPDGSWDAVEGQAFVMACNAIGTPRILLNSSSSQHPDGLANSSGLVGRRLMVHPFANVMGYFEDDLRGYRGHVGAKIVCFEFYESDDSRDFVRGAKWSLAPTGGPLNAAMPTRAGGSVWGAGHHDAVRAVLGRTASWGIFGEDLPDENNRVVLHETLTDSSGIPAPAVQYRVSENSRRLLDFHIARAEESLLAAGAYRTESESLMRYSGWHLLGTTRMGNDPESSVVDPFGRAHDVRNLFIVDGGTFVTSGGVNPTSTIVALALRTADYIVDHRADITGSDDE